MSKKVRLGIMMASNAASVSTLYINQALFGNISASFPENTLLSLVPGLTLIGYAAGVAAVASGSRRFAISTAAHLGLLSVAIAISAAAPNSLVLMIANLSVGCGAAVAQRLLAAAAQEADPGTAGAVIGKMICAALFAVFCVKLWGGFIADVFGWRSVLASMACLIAILSALTFLARNSGQIRPWVAAESRGFWGLWREHRALRSAAIQQAALFAAFNAVWMTVLSGSPGRNDVFTIVSGCSAGLFASFLAGKLVDRRRQTIAGYGAAAVLTATSLLLPIAYGATPGLLRTGCFGIGLAFVDAGMQIALVSNQTQVQALDSAERSRLAASLTIAGFLGGALGTCAGGSLYRAYGWTASLPFAAVASLLGLCARRAIILQQRPGC